MTDAELKVKMKTLQDAEHQLETVVKALFEGQQPPVVAMHLGAATNAFRLFEYGVMNAVALLVQRTDEAQERVVENVLKQGELKVVPMESKDGQS